MHVSFHRVNGVLLVQETRRMGPSRLCCQKKN